MKYNKQVYWNDVYTKMMNNSLGMIAEECFFNALPYSFTELDQSDKMGLDHYVSSAIEQLGGAKNILSNAINRVSGDSTKINFLNKIQQCCNEMAMEAADRITKEKESQEEDGEFIDEVKDANFNEEEFRKFETQADKLELEEIGDIISKKVVAAIRGEQEAFRNEQQLDDKITELISEQTDQDSDTYEEDVEKGVESFYKVALKNENPRHYVSLLSKLINAATESIVTLYPNEDGINIKSLNDVTFLFGLDVYRKQMSAEEALDRLVDVDATLINTNEFASSAMESLEDPETAKKGFVVGATAYTFMETMKTMNLISPTVKDITKFINTVPEPSSYGNCAVESFIKRSDDIFKDFHKTIRSIKDPYELMDYGKHFDGIREKLESVAVASESFNRCREDVYKKIRDVRSEINRQYESLVPAEESVLNAQQRGNLANDKIAIERAIKLYGAKEGVSELRLVYNDMTNSRLLDFEALNNGGVPITKTTVFLQGMESNFSLNDVKEYVKARYRDLDNKYKDKPFTFKAKSGSYERF